ncbi:MAG: hypothetical protein O2917_06830 [Acidobacteria bacterium]|nr:hypothetical protein [Acidobacteriota bacterium]
MGDLSGPVETYAKAPNLSRAVIHLDLTPMGMSETMTIDQRFDGTNGAVMNSLQDTTPMEGDQLNSMRNNVFPRRCSVTRSWAPPLRCCHRKPWPASR